MSSKTYVDSTVYSFSGDHLNRESYLRSTIASAGLTGAPSMADYLISKLQTGPANRLEAFFRWARNRRVLSPIPGLDPDDRWYPGVSVDTLSSLANAFSKTAVNADLQALTGMTSPLYIFDVGGVVTVYDFAQAQHHWRTLNPTRNTYNDLIAINETTRVCTVTRQPEMTQTTFILPPSDPDVQYSAFLTTTFGDVYQRYDLLMSIDIKVIYYVMDGSRPVLENVQREDLIGNMYYPIIPIRLDNVMVREGEPGMDQLAPSVAKGYKKAFGQDIGELFDQLEDNPDLDEIDFVYIMFGVPINTTSREARAYLYTFFNDLYLRDEAQVGANLRGITISTDNFMPVSGGGYKKLSMTVRWRSITKSTKSGLAFTGAGPGDCNQMPFSEGDLKHMRFRRQMTDNTYDEVVVYELSHYNHVYNGVAVELDCDDEWGTDELSGFLIPLSHDVVRKTSLVTKNQLAMDATHLVINSYKVVKKKWYQTGIFKVFLVIAAIALAVWSGGGSIGAMAGVLGTNAAVGAAIGLTGIMGALVGLGINMIAGAIVTRLIMSGATALFGEEIGAIIAVVATFVTMQGFQSMANGGSFMDGLKELMTATGLYNITLAVGNGVSSSIQYKTEQIIGEMTALHEDYEKQSDKIEELNKALGQNTLHLNPLELMDGFYAEPPTIETPSAFLQRTLMTGHDIADLTQHMISGFTDLSMQLPSEI